MKTSSEGRRVLEHFEGRELRAYPDPATKGDPWTIGVGHTGPEVHRGLVWTEQQVDEALDADLRRFEDAVESLTSARPPNQGQFDALVLLAFNIGEGNLRGSTLLRLYRAGDIRGAADQFVVWNKARQNGVLAPMLGLTRRRVAERQLFSGSTAATAIATAKLVTA
jgi:lysozyme